MITLKEKARLQGKVKELTPFQNKDDFELSQRIGRLINFSTLIEQEGSPQQRLANAVVLQDLARTTNLSIFTLAREIYIVKGKIGFSAKFYRAVCNASGEFLHRLRFKFFENDTSCVCYTRDVVDGELLESVPYSLEQARNEGLFSKAGSKWNTRPKEMLCNRATVIFANMFASHLFLGVEKYVKDAMSEVSINDEILDGEVL